MQWFDKQFTELQLMNFLPFLSYEHKFLMENNRVPILIRMIVTHLRTMFLQLLMVK